MLLAVLIQASMSPASGPMLRQPESLNFFILAFMGPLPLFRKSSLLLSANNSRASLSARQRKGATSQNASMVLLYLSLAAATFLRNSASNLSLILRADPLPIFLRKRSIHLPPLDFRNFLRTSFITLVGRGIKLEVPHMQSKLKSKFPLRISPTAPRGPQLVVELRVSPPLILCGGQGPEPSPAGSSSSMDLKMSRVIFTPRQKSGHNRTLLRAN